MKIPVVFATDENYFFYTCVAITSLARSAALDTEYEVYILTGKPLPDRYLLDEIEQRYPNIELQIIEVERDLFCDVIIHNSHVTKTTFYRLLLCDLLDVEKCIYLDSDVIVTEDLQPLFSIDLNGAYIAGCRDIWIDMLSDGECEKRRERTKIPSMDEYINAGVLVMDLARLRAAGAGKRFIEHLRYDHPYEDQDIINICCYGKILHLPAKWNIFTLFLGQVEEMRAHGISEEIIQDLRRRKGIIHYATPFMRPWEHFYCWGNQEWWDVADEWKGKSCYQELKERVQRKEELEEWVYYLKKSQEYERVIIFGHTVYGKQICDQFLNAGIREKLLFCDNDPKKKEMVYRGIKTLPLDEVKKKSALFINSSQRRNTEVTKLLMVSGVKREDIICYQQRMKEYYQYLDDRYYLSALKDIFLRERGTSMKGFEEDLAVMRERLKSEADHGGWQDRYHLNEWILKEG